MTFFQWRRFNFFDIARDVDEGSLEQALQGRTIFASSSGRGHLMVGDDQGNMHILNRQFRVTSFRLFNKSIALIHQLKQSGLVMVIGEQDAADANPYLKVLDLDRLDKEGNPAQMRMTRVSLGQRVSTATAASAHENHSLMAIGFENGVVVLLRGDIAKDRGSKQKVILEADYPITGLALRSVNKAVYLYVSTTNQVLCVNVTIKDKETTTALDNVGCPKGLAIPCDSLSDTHFITARNDAVYCYTSDGRGQCYAFEGEKVAVFWFRSYLAVVTAESSAEAQKQTLTLFDVQNKFIAFTAPIKAVRALLSEWGLLYAVTTDNKLLQLTEKDIQSKLELLFKKNFYDIAVKIAKAQQYDEDSLVDIFRQYGDHLYIKGDFSGAIENYIKTIGHLEPSYIIRKFLDAHKIHHLTEYLQSLHQLRMATSDHTTLLLNCYTKLKDKNKLDEFIFKDREQVDFDVAIAIRVCRQSGYNMHALELAKKHQLHEWYLRMQVEDLRDYRDAIKYIASLDFESAEGMLKKYGGVLMRQLPDASTELLKTLCTDYKPRNELLISERALSGEEDAVQAANAEEFLHFFVKNSSKMVDFLEHLIRVRPETGAVVYNTLLEHYLHQYSEARDDFEFKRRQEDKVMSILKNEAAGYDSDQALILCQLHGFRKGSLFVLERKGHYGQLLQCHAQAGDIAAVLATCRRFGPQEPCLWAQALQVVAQIGGEAAGAAAAMAEILDMTEKHRLLSPLLVLSTLTRSPNATLGLVRDFLLRVLQTEDKRIKQDQAVIEQYRGDTKKVREHIDSLKKKAVVFQVSKCSACSHALEVPSVHFLCQHSYHQHCFQSYSDTETECPMCAPMNKKIMDVVQAQEKSRDQHDAFHHQLDTAENSFSVVSEYFGRGMFRKSAFELAQQVKQHAAATLTVMAKEDSKAGVVGVGAEARLRAQEGKLPASFHQSSTSIEARLREAQPSRASPTMSRQSEARMRSSQTSEAARGRPTPDARMRLAEGERRAVAGSLKAKPSPAHQHQHHPAAARSVPKAMNPFGDFADEDLGKNNPFASEVTSTNPFGDPDEEFDESNPFSEQ